MRAASGADGSGSQYPGPGAGAPNVVHEQSSVQEPEHGVRSAPVHGCLSFLAADRQNRERGTPQPTLGNPVTAHWGTPFGPRLSGAVEVPGYNSDLIAQARRYNQIAPAAALGSLERAVDSWAASVTAALDDGVVLQHDELICPACT